METYWSDDHTAISFDKYDDTLEQTLGYNFVFNLLNENLTHSSTVLDFGCGPGKVALRLAETGYKKIIAVDDSVSMLSIARQKRSHPNISYYKIVDSNLSFIEDSSIDAAIACFVFINVPSEHTIQKIVREIYRILKINARFIVLDTNPDSTGIQFSTFINGLTNKSYAYGEKRQEILKVPGHSDLILNDFHWPKEMYQTLLCEAGFKDINLYEPTVNSTLGTESEKSIAWGNELTVPPFVIFDSKKD